MVYDGGNNTPPYDKEYGDYDIGEADEIYEVNDEDELIALLAAEEEAGIATGAEGMEEEDEEEAEEDMEEGDEVKTNPVIYSNHKGSVFDCALTPSGEVGASGGEDDKAYVWETDSGSTLFECTEHKDSVHLVSFSYNGSFLATGDMSGFIQVWKVSTRSKVWEFDTEDLNWLTWHPSSNVLFAGTRSGEVWMWLIPQGNTKALAHAGISSECGQLTRDGKRLCVGFADGAVKVLDLKSGQTVHSFSSHANQITSISCHQDNNLVMTGSTDCTAKILNSGSGKEIATLSSGSGLLPESEESGEAESDSYDHYIEAVSFCPTIPNLGVTATLSGIITVWDIHSRTNRHHIVQGCGTSSLTWHPTEPYFFTAGLDGNLRVFDVRSAEQLYKFKGHRAAILNCAISQDGSKVVTSSDDSTVRILSTGGLWT